MLEPLNHYALENHPTVYDEESLTALELCARTAGKVNEIVTAFNKLEGMTKEAIEYMTVHIKKTTENVVNALIEADKIHVGVVYDEATEALNISVQHNT